MLTYHDLFRYLAEKCDFRKRRSDGEYTWNCDGKLTFTEQYCRDHFLDFESTKGYLELMGGWCDCEVLFNVEGHMDEEMSLPRLSMK